MIAISLDILLSCVNFPSLVVDVSILSADS